MNMGRTVAVLGAATLAGCLFASMSACDGVENSIRFQEPFRVRGAQFVPGPLPGATPGPDANDGGAPAGPLAIQSIEALNTIVYAGEGGKQIGGRVSDDAVAVALAFEGIGNGYWLIPTGLPDALYAHQLTWSAPGDFSPTIAPGTYPLHVVAIGVNATAGQQVEQNFCIASRVPDNLSSCDPTINPPEAVFSLAWDSDVDLDLHIISPDGRDINPKHPLVDPVPVGKQPPRTDPQIDRDSLAGCVPDAIRQEDLAFPARPTGTWLVYVNEFDSCGKASVNFTLTVYEPEGTPGAGRHLVKTITPVSGRLLALDADGDSSQGLFVLQYPF